MNTYKLHAVRYKETDDESTMRKEFTVKEYDDAVSFYYELKGRGYSLVEFSTLEIEYGGSEINREILNL